MDKRMRSLTAGLCAAAVLTGGLAVWAADGDQQEETRPVNPTASYFETVKQDIQGKATSQSLSENDRLVCENSRLALYVDEDDFIIKVLDKQGNYVWSSGAADHDAQSMTGTWKRFSRAFLTMDYYNGTGASLRSSARFNKETANLVCTDTGLAATLRFQEPDATVRVYIDITNDGFTVRIPDEEMVFNKPENRLAKLYVLPFLGSSYSDSIPGYFFIPDGSGALMRFDKPKTYNSSTLLRIYGPDYSVSAPTAYQSGLAPTGVKNLNFPLYGAVHGANQNAFMGVITSGEVYAGFEISPAGVKIDSHWMSPVFIYREQYRQATSSSVGYDVVQKVPNTVNPEITYTLLSGEEANYVGMANAYRRQLDARGALPKPTAAGEDIPVFIQALMADQAKSLFGHTTKVFTTLEDVGSWTDKLGERGVNRLLVYR